MPAPQVKVVYDDGSEELIKLKPRAMIAAERKLGADMGRIEGTMYATWSTIVPGVKFDEWLATVDSIEDVDDPDPTEATEGEQ